jgi:putative Mn2+ efflux pump MntP
LRRVALFAVFALALGLSMDTAAVALSVGFGARDLKLAQALRMSAIFAAFHAGMPLLGVLVGQAAARWVSAVDHWIAFALLALIGGKMLWEARARRISRRDGTPLPTPSDPFHPGKLVTLATATSIDALGAGFSLPLLGVAIPLAAGVLGVVPFVVTLSSLYVGRRFGARFGAALDALGGLVLIAIGVAIVLQHAG